MPSAASERTICTTSSLAPTSMPRVGSTRTSTRGAWVSHLASATFCWLPPDSAPSRASTFAGRTPRRCVCTPAMRPLGRRASSSQRETIFEKGDRDVAIDRLLAKQHRAAAFRRHSRRRRACPRVVLARRDHARRPASAAPPVGPQLAEQRAREFDLAAAHEAVDAEHFAGARREARRRDRSGASVRPSASSTAGASARLFSAMSPR